MKTFNQALKLIPLAVLLLIIYSCSKDPCADYQSKEFSYRLSDTAKAQIPFKGFDTLIYISNKGDTALLIGSKKYNYTDVREINTSGSPDCSQIDIYRNEFIDVRYTGSNPNLFYVFYSSTVDYNNKENIKTNINYISEYEAYTDFYNNTLTYTTPVIVGGQTIYGHDIDRKDGKPSFIYNKAYGLLQVKITDSLTYILNK